MSDFFHFAQKNNICWIDDQHRTHEQTLEN